MPRKTKRRGPGEGSLEQLPSGKWRVIITDGKTKGGKQNRVRSPAFEDRKDAIAWRNEQLDMLRDGTVCAPSRITMKDWIEKWLDGLALHVSRGTMRIYRWRAKDYLIPRLGEFEMRHVTPAVVDEMVRDIHKAGATPTTIRGVLNTLRQCMKEAKRLKKIYVNPAEEARRPKYVKKEMRCWTLQETQRFLEANAGHPLYALFVLALDTGMRQGELLGLRWCDVNLDEHWVDVKFTLEEIDCEFRLKAPKTEKSRRRIWIGRQALEALKAIRDKPEAFVFRTANRTHHFKANINDIFKRAIKRAGVPRIRFHDLRHTNATMLIQAGVGIKTVSERLGHSNVKITLDTYAHVLPGEQKAVSEVTSKLLEPVSRPQPTEKQSCSFAQVNESDRRSWDTEGCAT